MLAVDTHTQPPLTALTDDRHRSGSPRPFAFKDYSVRYPPPDPSDPFAPLSTLRSRRFTLQGSPPPEVLSLDNGARKTPVESPRASSDMATLTSTQPSPVPSPKKAARHITKSPSRHEFPVTEHSPQKELLDPPKADRRRSLSTPTRPVTPLLPVPQIPPLDIPVGQRRPSAAASGLRSTVVHTKVDPTVVANISSAETTPTSDTASVVLEETTKGHKSKTQSPLATAESPSHATNRHISFPKFVSSKKHHYSTSTLVEVTIDKKTSPASTPLPDSVAPSIHEIELLPPLSFEEQPHVTTTDKGNRTRHVRNETLPSLVSSKSYSSSSGSSTIVFNPTIPSPVAADLAIPMYQQTRKSLSNPRLRSSQSSTSPAASPTPRPHTSSGISSQARLSDPSSNTNPVVSTAPPDVSALPTPQQLSKAALIDVIAESGVRVPFGRLFMGQKTIVCFIRHFWCSNCQDYMYSVSKTVDPHVLRQAGANLVIISNGSYHMIKPYRHIFGMPFALYTDPSLKLYTALGMMKRSKETNMASPRGSYVRHGTLSGFAMVLKNALKVGMPILENGGDVAQLGGEFILGPGLKSAFAHRMFSSQSHTPILTVLKLAIDISETVAVSGPPEMEMTEEERVHWMRDRQKKLSQMIDRKSSRRGGEKWCERDNGESTNSTDNIPEVVHPETPLPAVEEVPVACSGLNGFQTWQEKKKPKTRKRSFVAKTFRLIIRRKRKTG